MTDTGTTLQIALSVAALLLTAGFAVFIISRKERTVATYALFAALTATIALNLFDMLAFYHDERFAFWKRFALMAESALPLTWLIYSLTFSRKADAMPHSLYQKGLLIASLFFVAAAASAPVPSFFYSPDFIHEKILFLENVGFIFYIGMLLSMVIILVNLENTLLTATGISRWKIKYEVLGAGALISMFIFFYSQALLYRSINMHLIPLRSSVMIIAVLLMAYSKLKRPNGVKIYVSRQMAYKSIVILFVSIYFIGLGLMGEGMRYFGKSLQRTVLISLAFVTGIGLITVLLSETLKRKVKVFLHKNFYANKYDYRMQWLQFTDKLSSSRTREDLLKSILSGFCETFGMEGAVLFLYNKERGQFQSAATHEMPPLEISFEKDSALIRHMEDKRWIYNTKDGYPETGAAEKRFMKQYDIAFLIPLITNGTMEGIVALVRPIDKNEIYTFEDYDLMKTLARQTSSTLLNLRLSGELLQAREMEALGRISTFVVHDLKNLVTALSLVLDNAREYMDNPEFQSDMLCSLDATVIKMRALIARLKDLQEKEVLLRERVDLNGLVSEVVQTARFRGVTLAGGSVYSEVDEEEIKKVVLNLVLNAIEATNGQGPVNVMTGSEENSALIRVSDRGPGIPHEFQQNCLFKPFMTTKKKGLGIGLYQCKQIVEAHSGRIEVKSDVASGTVFSVYLPLVQETMRIVPVERA